MKIAVLGLGYVGLQVALKFGAKYTCVGFDVDGSRVEKLKCGLDTNMQHGSADFEDARFLSFSSDESDLFGCNVYIVAVPTPLTFDNLPDLSYLSSACSLISQFLKTGDVVVFESSVYPGCTRDFCIPILSKSGLVLNADFGVAYSPERLSSSSCCSIQNVVKVVGASSDNCLDFVSSLYEGIVHAGVHRVESIEIAEACKMLENIQRDVNIAFMNEMAKLMNAMDINIHSVLSACRSKWNFLDFKPGFVGGHCICVNPYYLMHEAKRLSVDTPLMKVARSINDSMDEFVVGECVVLMRSKGFLNSHAGACTCNVLMLGASYKADSVDTRNSYSFRMKKLFIDRGINAYVCDNPEISGVDFGSIVEAGVLKYHCVVVVSMHSFFNAMEIKGILEEGGIVYDLGGALA